MQRARQPRANHRSVSRDNDRDRRNGGVAWRSATRTQALRDWQIWTAPALRRRNLRIALGGLTLTGAMLITGCDSVSGVPDANSTAAHNEEHTTTARPTNTSAAPQPAPEAVPADAPEVGAVADVPEAEPALRRWAADLTTGSPADLQARCWTIAPQNVADMYTDHDAILAALAQPGQSTENTVVWRNAGTTVSAERSTIATGYACPRVATGGAEIQYNDADARHTVRRYLSRLIGKPLDPADTEADFPLVCRANTPDWDPTGTGTPYPPPLATSPGALTGTTAFDDQEIQSEWLRGDYMAVRVPVTNAAGTQQIRTFTVTEHTEGYCLGAVSV